MLELKFIRDKLYFAYQNDGGNIYSMNLDGSKLMKLTSGINGLTDYTIFEGSLYYKLNNEIYKMNLDGTKSKKLIEYIDKTTEGWTPVHEFESGNEIKIKGDYIYYTNQESLYRFNRKTMDNEEIVAGIQDRYILVDDKIYYRNQIRQFFEKDLNDGQIKQLQDGPIREIAFLKGKYLYYRTQKYDEIFRMNIQDYSKEKVVGGENVNSVNFNENSIYYQYGEKSESSKLIKILTIKDNGDIKYTIK